MRAGYVGRMGPPRRAGGGITILDTLMVSLPSYTNFTRASTATYYNSTGTLVTAAINEARFDHDPVTLAPRGLLVEPAATNVVEYSSLAGAVNGVVGSGGALPTGWSRNGDGGLTTTVSNYNATNSQIDIRVSGTPLTTGFYSMFTGGFADMATVTASTSYTQSGFFGIVGGSTTNISLVEAGGLWFNGAAYLSNQGAIIINSTYAFKTNTSTSPASANLLLPRPITLGIITGLPIDITIRVRSFQCVAGTVAGSFIPTSGTAVTRSGDVPAILNLPAAGITNPLQGTFIVNFRTSQANNNWLLRFADNSGVGTNAIGLLVNSSGTLDARINSTAGGQTWIGSAGAVAVNTNHKAVFTWDATSAMLVLNGGTVVTDAAITLPLAGVLNRAYIGVFDNGAAQLNGTIGSATYLPYKVSSTQAKALSA